ncbi:nuclease-related domain-containing protein [Mycoplasma sp. Ms02]|uniref:nuclease-related domain-containing protein n=1 Tax=Mycoplasma sp. Ms02 TaxID=353851 RepID=UPI001C8A6DC0|nr:nuclease-related domain-containing protein [Mycoplasma sp. Ms02]QZE12379.1 NERD domain-containing protein [Mycoplasma sp. Ms02]
MNLLYETEEALNASTEPSSTSEAVDQINMAGFISGLVIVNLLLIAGIVFLVYYLKTRHKKNTEGLIFESSVSKTVKDLAWKNNFEFINGGTFQYDGKMFEIDGLLYNEKVAIVVEMKSYHGSISGDSSSEYLYITNNRGKKNKIKNPLLQNLKHMKHIRGMQPSNEKAPLLSLIIAPNDAKFDIYNVPSHHVLVNDKDLPKAFEKIVKSTESFENKVNKQHFASIIENMRARTAQEAVKFKKITGQK